MIILFILAMSTGSAHAFVLNNANTLGSGKMAVSGIYSVTSITTQVPDVITADISNYTYGIVFQYGLLEDLDLMAGVGTLSYSITPDVAGVLRMDGGMLVGLGAKYELLDENDGFPVSLAFLLQHSSFPAILIDSGDEKPGWDNDTYYKLIISKIFPAFFPFAAVGVNSRELRVGDTASSSSIFQFDIGYGTAVSRNIFIGVELNWSGSWNDPVLDDILDAETRADALGYSFGVQYLF